jgi:hypothetical protein
MTEAAMKSFHARMKRKIAEAANPGFARGMRILTRI